MKSNYARPATGGPLATRITTAVSLFAVLVLIAPLTSFAYSLTGESDTYLRARQDINNNKLIPLYDYMQFSLRDFGPASSLSFNFGGWGRVDLRDKETDSYTNGDLQYAYLSYRGSRNNAAVNLGRFFVAEGVAAEKIDGIYARTDLKGGFGASAFVGSPVETLSNFGPGEFIYGGRVTHEMPGVYTLGVSALKEDNNGNRFREEEGIDLWLHPIDKVDLLGKSSYNSITDGWMEHTYSLSVGPFEELLLNAEASRISYHDFFTGVTSSAFSLNNGILNPDETVLILGGGASYTIAGNIVVAADYKNYNYDIAGDADYFGGKATYLIPGSGTAGVAYHRMNGEIDRLKYDEYRAFASKTFGKADLTLDFFDVAYDKSINNVKNAYNIVASAGYELAENMKIGADVDYGRNPDLDNEVQGLVKFIYNFDITPGKGKGEKSEK